MNKDTVSAFFVMSSFEPRSIKAVNAFIKADGKIEVIRTAQISNDTDTFKSAISKLEEIGVHDIPCIDRLSSHSLWEWVWTNTKNLTGDVIIDATCFTRELLGMLLFALSVRRDYLSKIQIQYVSPAPKGYITQNEALSEDDKWLSRGVISIRSIIGYPGDFRSERRRRVVALAGHEKERLWETIEFLEPDELSISSPRLDSSTVEGANLVSEDVAKVLRERIRIPVPNIGPVEFSANSINETYNNLIRLLDAYADENIALVPMNTKLSFIGAALAALCNRRVRLVYAVPEEYNPLYSTGEGDVKSFDITHYIKNANTTPVQKHPNE